METLTADEWQLVRAAFDSAVDLPPAERSRFVASGTLPPKLRAELAGLLAAVDETGDFLEQPLPAVAADRVAPSPIAPQLEDGTRLGAWRVGALLGRGGMGEVYRAERADGLFEQTAALKLLRPEAASHWQRFESERQILARLEHPGIARLLDGGLTAGGRPYMVMEFVSGTDLLSYCAAQSASLDRRLELFLAACEAVAFAHDHLVVHRDLKPANLMVGDSGQVKLLDFGVAKLLDQTALSGTETQTLVAPFTPQYAAPEQIDGRPVSTATDVYALGLVLFELLVGAPPWLLRDVPLSIAVDRLMREEVPPASQHAKTLSQPATPPKQLSGDLDAILAKALRKEPQQRYRTVRDLAQDIRRYLDGHPVAARAGHRLYRWGRFIRRNRWGVAAAATLLLAMLGSAAGYGMWREAQAQARLEQARHEIAAGNRFNDFLTLMFRGAGGEGVDAREVLRDGAGKVLTQYGDDPEALANLVQRLSDLFIAADDTEGAAALLEHYLARKDPRDAPAARASVLSDLAVVEVRRGNAARAAELLAQAQAIWREDPALDAVAALRASRVVEAQVQRANGDLDGAIVTLQSAIAEREKLLGPDDDDRGGYYQNLGAALAAANRPQEALRAFEAGWAAFKASDRTHSPDALALLNSWAVLAANRGLTAEAEQRYRAAIDLWIELYGDSVQLAAAYVGLGRVLALTGRWEEGLPRFEQARTMAERFAGANSPIVVSSWIFAADALLMAPRLDDVAVALERVRAALGTQYGDEHPLRARLWEADARLQLALRRPDAAARLLDAAIPVFRKVGTGGVSFLAQALLTQARLYLVQGRHAEAVAAAREALALRETTSDAGTWPLAEAQGLLGLALQGADEGLLANARSIVKAQLGSAHPLARELGVQP